MGFSEKELVGFLRQMLLFRRFEEKAEEAYAIGKIGGFCHLHIGQEASAAGSIGALRDDDYLVTAYREHTQALAKGVGEKEVMAELYGKAPGASAGKGGSMHIFGVDQNFMGGHGIVGGQVPLATGMGWAIKYRGEDRVAMCFMGEAAVNQGAFHESLNMAAIWNLPVIFVVENNGYGMGTAFDRISATRVDERSVPYGIPASVVYGQDVLLAYRHFEKLAAEVRAGGGPRFVEVRTYRFRGHSMSDPVSGTYRSKEEVTDRIENEDPIKILRDRLFDAGSSPRKPWRPWTKRSGPRYWKPRILPRRPLFRTRRSSIPMCTPRSTNMAGSSSTEETNRPPLNPTIRACLRSPIGRP